MINLFALWLLPQFILGFKIPQTFPILAMAALSLTLLNLFAKPVLKILLLPLNLVTFGLFSWVVNVLILYALTLIFPQITISGWHFSGLTYNGFIVPAIYFNLPLTYIATSFCLSFISNTLEWLIQK